MAWRILVVDDDPGVAFFTKENLAGLGAAYHVEAVTSGEEALRKMAAEPYDLVIADLRMPGMNGLELLYRIRKRYPQTRLILMTAYGNDRVQEAARRLQVYRYIAKPFQIRDLVNAVRAALGGFTVNTRGVFILSDERYEKVAAELARLQNDTGAQVVLLCDAMGQTIARVGDIEGMDLMALTALVAGGLNATLEMRRLLGEKQALDLNYHEGDRFDVYSTTVGDNLFLLFLFDRRVATSRVGMVWLITKRAVTRLRDLTTTEQVSAAEVLGEDFGHSLLQEVDGLFAGDDGGMSLEEATEQLAAEVGGAMEEEQDDDPGPLLSFDEAVARGLVPKDLK